MARMTDRTASLVELARRHGVATEYIDWSGTRHAVAATTLVAVLAALGVPAEPLVYKYRPHRPFG